jgi:mRNA interferase MazF
VGGASGTSARSRTPEGRAAALNRGDIYDVDWLDAGQHPAVVITRDDAVPYLGNVTLALITSTIRELPTEVRLGPEQGLRDVCVINCDNLLTAPKEDLRQYRGHLDPTKMFQLNRALKFALGLDLPI